ncbi:putative ATP-dependent permease [Diplogelasinospora grovesii]|uniref:ATP-dependent permease n=1 Tax=Diplogelasinospora grovesii TaxID=303347 RepID=A0AAN6N6X7_9PEZI|nr:putative ATP-dependent permease [Diplogelasinospora grovesii]
MELATDWLGLWPCYSCCHEFWIPSLGQFGPQCLGIFGNIPLWIALLVFVLRYGLRPVWSRRPFWLRLFAAEEAPTATTDQEIGTYSLGDDRKWTAWTASLLVLSMINGAFGVAGIAVWQDKALLFMIPVVPSFISTVILAVERPRAVSGPVFIINAVLFTVELTIIAVVPGISKTWPGIVWMTGICLPLASLTILLNMPVRDPQIKSDHISKPFTEPTYHLSSPEDAITLWQWMSVSWMAPLIAIGKKRQIHNEDVWLLPYEWQHSRLHRLFREVPGSVLIRLLKANAVDLIITTSLGLLESSAELAEPVLLKQILAALNASPVPQTRAAIVYAGLTFFLRLLRGQSGVFSLWFQRRNYERSRGELVTMLHEKTLRRKAFTIPDNPEPEKTSETPRSGVSTSTTLTDNESDTEDEHADARPQPSRFQWLTSCFRSRYQTVNPPKPAPPAGGPSSTGKILNVLRGDLYEVAQRMWEFPSIFTKPFNFIISIVLIWNILGPASLAGILILVAAQVFNVLLMRALLRVERARRAITDVKLQRTSQFIEAIRHLRWYDWQDAWLTRILDTRQAELMKRVHSNVLTKIIATMNQLALYTFPVAGFAAYTLVSGKPLTVDVAFPALDLFNMLQSSLRELPDLFTTLLNAKVSMDRIESFMKEPEKDDADEWGSPKELGKLEISAKGASFSWPGSSKKVLRDVSFSCKPGLNVVCGKVAIGKTALLQAILGEMDQHGGERTVPHEMVGYCAQSPWLQSMSMRENILFCAPYDEIRYRQVLDACCLLPDLANFKAGDLSMIGENGVGLSGGQKARVALARAVYSRARILLLDDPIAALDHQTAETILRKLFGRKDSPLMAGRLVIFVTHRVDIVTRYADQVLDIVDGGRVKTFSREELENNEELRHLAATAACHYDGAEDEQGHEDSDAIPDKFIEEEHRPHGGVLASVYWQYIKAGQLRWWFAVIAFFILFRVAKVGYFWFLKEWGENYGDNSLYLYAFGRESAASSFSSHQHILRTSESPRDSWLDLGRYLPSPNVDVRPWLFWFCILSVAQVIASGLSDVALVVIIYNAGKHLFQDAMHRVSNATFRFYDVTPVGRLMNRLTSDMSTIDGHIAYQLMDVAWYVISWLSSVAVIASATPAFLVLTLAMTALFVLIFDRFLPTSQSLRRLEMVSLSPLFSNFGALLEGLTTIRAFKAEPHFQDRIIETTDMFQKMDHFYWSLQAWLQYRFDILSAFTTFLLTLTAIYSGLSAGVIGFVLASASNFVQSTHNLCRRYGEMQMQFVSVERVIELLQLEQEPQGDRKPAAGWPSFSDDIVFDGVTLRYAPELDPSLQDVSFRIPAGSSVAVTGRTGSGKSTLALALLGTLLPDTDTQGGDGGGMDGLDGAVVSRRGGGGGTIHIGGMDLAKVDKHALRQRISFVAQDPVLFPGTLRDNLDPLHEFSETDCSDVIRTVLGDGFTLDSKVDGGGKNLSQGQRQLVGLGRAILRRSPVVIMDEATASIDTQTAHYIQQVLREELKESTVITIAHRVEAVRDANYSIVLDKGRVVSAGPVGH